MFGIIKSLSSEEEQPFSSPENQDGNPQDRYADMRLQPTLLSAVEGTLSSYYKETGDNIIDYLETLETVVYFDDNLPGTEGTGYYVPEDNVIVLSSKPADILDIAKELYRVLKTIK